jgi:hypothetical protein
VALLVGFEPLDRAIAILVGDLGQTLAKIVLVDPGTTLLQVSARFGAHHVHAVVAIRVTHFRPDMIATLLVITSRCGDFANGLVNHAHRTGCWHERFRLLMLTAHDHETDHAWNCNGNDSHETPRRTLIAIGVPQSAPNRLPSGGVASPGTAALKRAHDFFGVCT